MHRCCSIWTLRSRHFLSLLFGVAILSLAMSPTLARAQGDATAQISGVVTDPSGAAVPSAKITATQTVKNLTRTTVANGDGSYILPELPIGPYKLQVEATGFGTYVQTGITLQVGESPRVNITLTVGQTTEQVQVNSNATMVQTDTTAVSQVIDQQRMVDLPLNGRQPTQLILLSGAANNIGPANGASDLVSSKNYFSADGISVAGGQASGTHYLLDGGEHMDLFSNVNLPLPFPDALQEFSVDTSSLSARYGMHAGAVVNTATKSGSNQLHGGLFEFVRNGAANARDYFASSQDSLKRNQFGGVVGGPILKDKLFGFFGFQQTTTRTAPSSTISFTPTQAVLGGDFSQLESAGCQSSGVARTIIDPQTGQPFANNQVPADRLNQQALNLLKYVPVATDPCGKINYAIPEPQSEQQFIGRIDNTTSTKNSMFGRYFLANYSSPAQFSPSNILLATQRGVRDRAQAGLFSDTYAFSPTLVNSAHLGYTRLAITRGPATDMINFDKIGVNVYQPLNDFMNINIPGYFTVGCGTCSPSHFRQNNFQVGDDIDIVMGRHHISTGAEWAHIRFDLLIGTLANGTFNFNGQLSNDSLLDFMLGLPSQFQQGNLQPFDGRQNYFGAYVHDVWRVNKKLTAQAGVRWEPYTPGREIDERMHHFDPAAFASNTVSTQFVNAPPGLLSPGDPGIPSTFTTNKYWDFEPRLGFAWDPTGSGRMVLRAGYGLFYDMMPTAYWEDQTGDAPWGTTITLNTPSGGFSDPFANYPGGQPFPSPNPPPKDVTFPTQGTYYSYPTHGKPTYSNEWNLSYEIQPFKDWVISAAYLGNKTTHIWTGEDKNAGVYIPGDCDGSPCSTTSNTAQRRVLYLQNPVAGAFYGSIYTADDGANASYHALLLKAEHRFSNNYTVLANYTWSHCISEADFEGDLGGPLTQNPNDRNAERGNCGFDIRNSLNVSAVMESPRFKNVWADRLLGTWKLSPIVVARSGVWFTPLTGLDNSLTGIGLDRPNVAGNPYVRNFSDPGNLQWLTSAGFTPNPLGTFGNAGSDSLLGPDSVNVDVALSRMFHITERHQVELRFEAFNVLNHPNFSNPDNNLQDNTFGVILGDAGPRILQFAGKYQF
jgi:Carboxypeptidase regulatory-like domain